MIATGAELSTTGLLDDYQRQAKMNEHISSIEDMQRFLERCVLSVCLSLWGVWLCEGE